MFTVTLPMAPARVPIVPDTRTIMGSASTAHLAAGVEATAAGLAFVVAVVAIAIFQLAVFVATMVARAVMSLFRLLVFPLVVVLIVYLLSLAAHANGQPVPSGPTHSVPSLLSAVAPSTGSAERIQR